MKGLAVATNDAELLEQWTTRGDARAFDSLVAGYSGLVYSACRRILGNDADAQDATQECFLQLAQRTPKIQTSLAAWLHTVATRKAISRIREESRRTRREQSYAKDADKTVEAEWDDIQEFIDEAIRALPAENRVPLIASFLERKTHADIAKEIGVDRSTVSRRIDRGIEGIRDHLKEKGVIATSVSLLTMLTTKMTEAMPVGLTATLAKIALTGGRLQAAGGITDGGVLGSIRSVFGDKTAGITVTGIAALLILLGAFWFMRAQDVSTASESEVSLVTDTPLATEVDVDVDKDGTSLNLSTSDEAQGLGSEETDLNEMRIARSQNLTEAVPPPVTTGTVEGRVTLDGRPFPGVQVSVLDTELRYVAEDAVSNAAGVYTVENVPPGEHRIEANVGGRQIRLMAVVTADTTTTVDLPFEVPAASIAGKVTLKGEPPARFYARGWVYTPGGEEQFAAIDHEDGTYESNGFLPEGEAKLVVAAWDAQGEYYRRETIITLEPGVVAITDIEFSVTGIMHGVATGLLSGGQHGIGFFPVGTNVPKTLAEFTFDEFARTMDLLISYTPIRRDGTYHATGLEPGEYEFAAFSRRRGNEVGAYRKGNAAFGSVAIEENGDVELNLELKPLPES